MDQIAIMGALSFIVLIAMLHTPKRSVGIDKLWVVALFATIMFIWPWALYHALALSIIIYTVASLSRLKRERGAKSCSRDCSRDFDYARTGASAAVGANALTATQRDDLQFGDEDLAQSIEVMDPLTTDITNPGYVISPFNPANENSEIFDYEVGSVDDSFNGNSSDVSLADEPFSDSSQDPY